MSSAPPPRFPSVQILRGLAAVLVVLHHQTQIAAGFFAPSLTLHLLDNGAFGVDLFFPISGFVLYLSATRIADEGFPAGAARSFAWRRFVRVAPMYWGFTALKLLLALVVPITLVSYRFQLWNTVAGFLFLPAYNFMHSPEPPLPVGWTLSYEMLFYALMTGALALRRRPLAFCAVAIGLLAAASFVIPRRWGALTFLADPIELEFLAGMLIAAGIKRLRRLPAWLTALLLPAALAFALAYPPSPYLLEFRPERALVWGVPGALIVLSAVALDGRIDFARWRPLLLLGDASFALYLIHTFLLPPTRFLILQLGLHTASGLLAFYLFGLALCLSTAVLFHRYAERPLLRRLTHRHTPYSVRSDLD